MKNLKLLFVTLLLSTFGYTQNNQSSTSITDPISSPLSGEVFRFLPGLVTQSAGGSNFGFTNDQWFSIGEFNTGNNMAYGLRFQLPNRALTFGYQDTSDNNPRLQWIGSGENQGNLEFRFANDFMSTNSNLIATMTHNGQFILPARSISSSNGTKLSVTNNSYRTGINVNTTQFTTGEGVGISASAGFNHSNVSVKGTANGGISIGGSNIAIQGISNLGFAGFFNGNVTVTGTFTNSSDRSLKTDINITENALEKITQLNGYTYTSKDHEDLNLAKGLQHGLIAQEVELVYPELVENITYPIYNKEGEFEGTGSYKSVNYIGLISELTEAIKGLNAKVEDLESQLEPRVVYATAFSKEELTKIEENAYQLSQNTPNPFSDSTSIT
jgi:hypothetical protein